MPKLGESIIEATITKWLKNPGDMVAEDDPIVEIATDKVDSEIPSPVEGKLIKAFFKEGDVVAVGTVIAIVSLDGEGAVEAEAPNEAIAAAPVQSQEATAPKAEITVENHSDKFYSPLVKSIAKQEQIPFAELDAIQGSGKEGRVTKEDILSYIKNRSTTQTIVTPTPKQTNARATVLSAR